MTGAVRVTGFRRPDGRFGVRNHLLVLPSVVCATHAAGEIARASGAVALTHQHGCLHVGDDLAHTGEALVGTAVNPDVGGVVVVSLGCETLKGRRLARRIGERGQRVRFVGIQQAGGTERAVAEGRAAVAELAGALARDVREPLPPGALTVGVDAAPGDPLAALLRGQLAARGASALALGPDDGVGAETHVALAAAGAQVIVSLLRGERAPLGFVVCPVLAVGCGNPLAAALADDFDLALDGTPTEADAARVADAALAAAAGIATASERRGARDFVLRRLAMTM